MEIYNTNLILVQVFHFFCFSFFGFGIGICFGRGYYSYIYISSNHSWKIFQDMICSTRKSLQINECFFGVEMFQLRILYILSLSIVTSLRYIFSFFEYLPWCLCCMQYNFDPFIMQALWAATSAGMSNSSRFE